MLNDSYLSFAVFGGIVILLCVVLLAFFVFKRRIAKKGLVSHSLNLSLLLVRFPPHHSAQELTQQQIRERIAMMESLYANLSSFREGMVAEFLHGRPSFALELTVPSVGEELHFYVAVPRRYAHAVEKIIQGVFPNSHVEETKDYNIFHPDGSSLVSRVLLHENP